MGYFLSFVLGVMVANFIALVITTTPEQARDNLLGWRRLILRF